MRFAFAVSLLFATAAFAGPKAKTTPKPPAPGHRAGCTGSANCTACKNCSGCKHCKKDGGTCGVCKPK